MIYSLKLESALYLTGLLVLLAHALALFKGKAAQDWLRALPRSKPLGFVFLTVAAIWFFWLVQTMDLGEFSNWREPMRILHFLHIIPFLGPFEWLTSPLALGPIVAYVLALKYVDEFLAARALGMLVLLGAEPLLEAAFLRPEMSRLFLVTLVYVWVAFALFWVGMPFTLRDQIAWLTGGEKRWRAAVFAGLAYGALLLVLPLTFAKPA